MAKCKFLDNLSKFCYNGQGLATYIYFIISHVSDKRQDLNRVKIGISKAPPKRLHALQTGNPIPLYLWYMFKINEDQKHYLEKQLHQKFRWSKSKHGQEWFKIHPYIQQFIKAHKEMVGYTRKDYEKIVSVSKLRTHRQDFL